ncbi:glycoside hydrolase family 3 protein [Duganella sp. FT80W]|uniref:Glycoside hydrolase family 3 protein n=1 Tax=Duganella guangzhouensis TaxID=2666084 RepID=A0A6I2L6Z4_9BURK|nr:glycoside hydrolase family 3 C-terminal domain-containing protein [Duganella guangzhouensis]MRW93918.1 glycoside hydrolase family 3 protein [Duganella guangzhouensis]
MKTTKTLCCIAVATLFSSLTAHAADDAAAEAARLTAQMTLQEKASLLLNTSAPIERLGIPAYQWWNEALHGVVGDSHATNYPEPIGLAATFNAPLLGQVADAIGTEIVSIRQRKLARGGRQDMGAGLNAWAPNINIFRDPRWGRGQETYGEDPYLTGTLAVAYVRGIQGPDPDHPRVIATPKHFAVHSGPETSRHRDNVDVSLHDLRDTYLPAFRAAVVDGQAGSVMCAYNSINGQPACANSFLLEQTLRKDWGFKGVVVSDCDAVSDIYQHHRYTADAASASAAAIRAGMDNECSVDGYFDRNSFGRPDNYVQAVQRGDLSAEALDRAVRRTLEARLRVGDLQARAPADDTVGSAAHRALTLRAAEQSMVLLKNDGILPLSSRKLRIAVIGPQANGHRLLRGNYSERETWSLPSAYEAIRQQFPQAEVELVAAGPSITDGDPIPSRVLRSEDDQTGLTARYLPFLLATLPAPHSIGEKMGQLKDRQLASAPTTTRVEPAVSEAMLGPHPLLPDGGLCVWSGFLVPEVTGEYRIGMRGTMSSVELDGKPLADTGHDPLPAPVPNLKSVHLQAGQRYPIKVTSMVNGVQLSELVWQRVSATPEADAVAAAQRADVVVAVTGISSDLEGEESSLDIPGFKHGDRTTLDLPTDQSELLAAVRTTGKPLVVVNMSGSAVNLDWAKQHANAIVQAWYPGEAGGTAIARVLSGAVNPGGRLPVTFYRDVSQLPALSDYRMQGRTYRYFSGTPVYPFGYGLSYTRFAYGAVSVKTAGDGGITVSAEVSNTGQRDGDEVAQVYLKFPTLSGAPRIALRGYQRVSLQPGEHRRLTFSLSPRDLSSVSDNGTVRIAQGDYEVIVGGGQPGSGLPTRSAHHKIAKATVLPN